MPVAGAVWPGIVALKLHAAPPATHVPIVLDETAFHEQELSDTDSYENWSDKGQLDSVQRANRHWKAVLAAYEAPHLDAAIDEELQEFVTRKKRTMPDIWH